MKPRAHRSRLARVLDAVHRLYSVRDAREFPTMMMSVAEELVPCVNISFDAIDLATGQPTNAFLRPQPMTREEFMARWQALCHEHPGIAFLERGGKASVFTITDFLSQRQFRESALFQELFRPLGCDCQMGVILPVPGHVVGMAMNRDQDFAAGEREIIELLHAHFLQAFQNAQLFTSLRGHAAVDFRAWRRHGLTRRECDVLQWLVEGKRNSEIAIILGTQPRTIGKHLENIFAKLRVETRSAAAAEARRLLGEAPILPAPGQ
jgi:DNA-binding CsgD family transcriptional regulator